LLVFKELFCQLAARRFRFRLLRRTCPSSPSNRFVWQQQRNEIMWHFLFSVNAFLIYFFKQFKNRRRFSKQETSTTEPLSHLNFTLKST
jgi:hypothetical protein